MANVMILDTETTNSLDDPFCYDIGWAIINDKNGEIIKTRSFAVAEIFLNKPLMEIAYFAEKIPSYNEEIKQGKRELRRLYNIRKALRQDCEEYEIKEIYAHNARFDYFSCNHTQRYLTCSKYRYFFPYGIKICDTLQMSREVLGKNRKYRRFCKKNNYLTQRGENRYTAEIIYRFLTKNNDFIEEHKGIDDVLIEKDIFFYCHKRHAKNRALW